ncbi:putative Ig domain-containing protein [Spirosoma arcticum]
MKKIFTTLLFFLSLISAFSQKAPSNEPGSKEPPQADTTDIRVLSMPAGFIPAGNSTKAIPLGSSMIAKEEGLNESNNTAATAMPLGSTSVRLRGNLFPNGDIDFYSFTANAGDRVHAAVMTAFSAGSSTDSQLSLIASDGTTVLEFDDDNGSFAALSSSIAGAIIPASGTYYLKINDFTAATTSIRSYDLYLKVQSGSPTPEVEGNDTPATANDAPASGWISGSRNPAAATEQDWFALNLVAGETVFLSLDLDPERDGVTWNGRLGFAQFGDAANQIVVVNDAGATETPNPTIPSEAFFFTVKETGTYYLFVDSATPATGGPTATYTLSAAKLDAIPGYANYASADVPKTIGPGTGSVTSTITIPDTKLIKDLAVRITLNHALMADIDAMLTTPEGNQIALFTDIGATAAGGEIQMDVRFDDYNAIPPSFVVLKPVGLMPELGSKLDQLKGMKTNGTWTLTLYDDGANASGGTLTAWSLDVLEDTTPASLSTATTIYSQNFESSDGGFTHSGAADEWARGTPNTPATPGIAAFTTANSGVNCWKTDLTGTYEINSNQLLESADIDLTGVTSNTITLSWAMKYQMESATFDNLDVYVEEVGGSGTTQNVFTWLGATQNVVLGNPTVNVGMASGWGTYFADISAFKGKTVRIKIRLRSDNSVQLAGVAIDDVAIYAACTTPTVPVLAATNQTTICTGSVTSLSATCSVGTVNWYDAAGTGLLFTGSPFTTTALTANTIYNVRCENGPSCLSPFVQTTITVDPQTVGGTVAGSTTVCAGTNSTTLTLSGNVGTVQKWQSAPSADFSSPTDIANTTTSLTLSNLSQTTYYRAVVKSGACSVANSGTAVVTVDALITATISGASTVCSGQSTVLTASGGSSFLWSTGETTATISATAGTYSVTVSSGSCSATATATVTGVANPIATIVGTLTVSPGGSTTLTASGGTSFTWSTGETTASISATAGPYSVTVANSSGCTSTTSVTVTTVSPANQPPVATSNANQTATVGVAFTYTVNAFSDETPNSLSYTASISPTNGFNFDPATRIISGTPSMSGVSSVTVTATDPGSLSASTTFTITVNPAVVTPTAPFAITGVTTIDCTPVANRININFNPRYAGLNGQPISFSVVNELSPTTAPGPYTLQLYSDNPTIILKAVQSGTAGETSFSYNWLAACNSLSMVTPNNTAPTVANAIPPQSATVGQGFSYPVPANTFTDAETPNQLTLSANGLPPGLTFSGSTISGTPSTTVGSPFSVTITATDPGSLSVATSFTITVSPAASMTPTGAFSITGVTTIDCTPVANRININFTPRYAGLNGQPISFSVVNELSPTTAPGPYSLSLYPDNPVITLKAVQSGTVGEASFSYNWLAACNSLSMVTPNNTAPTVANAIPPQSATVGQGFSYPIPANTFTDAETPNQLTLSANGLPPGLTFSGSTISGTPSTTVGSSFSVTVTATDPGSLSVATSFAITVSPGTSMTSTAPFAITGVATVSCTVISAGQRQVSFTPQYAGTTGQPISFSVVNELSPTTAPGPYTLRLYTDNPVINLKATQSGTAGEVSFAYNWLTACNSGSGARVGVEPVATLSVRVLGNPTQNGQLSVEVTGTAGQPLRLTLTDLRGQVIGSHQVEQATSVERHSFQIGRQSAGILLLRASTPTQVQTVKVLKTE